MIKQGFSLLLTVLIVSIILSLALGIGSIVLNQIKLSGTGRQSQIAFYAADAGAECALYWDFRNNSFAISTGPNTIVCAGKTIAGIGGGGYVYDKCQGTSQDDFVLSFENNSCAHICVRKEGENTKITSFGRDKTSDPNKCAATEGSIERGLEVNF